MPTRKPEPNDPRARPALSDAEQRTRRHLDELHERINDNGVRILADSRKIAELQQRIDARTERRPPL